MADKLIKLLQTIRRTLSISARRTTGAIIALSKVE